MAQRRYGDIVRDKMMTAANKVRHPVTIRMMEKATGYTYEHIRKVVKNMPVVSRDLNQAICDYIGLDAEKMWSIAQAEKIERKVAELPTGYSPPPDPSLRAIWSKLLPADVQKLRRIAERMAEDNEAAGLISPRRGRPVVRRE